MSFPADLRFTVENRRPAGFAYGGCDMDYKLELVLIPVSDVDRAKKFYLEEAGFVLIVHTPIGEGKRVVQVVPPGSECAIGFGTGLTSAAPRSAQGLHLVVSDILAARAELVE